MNYQKTGMGDIVELVEMNFRVFDGMYEHPPYSLDEYKKRLEGKSPAVFVAKDGEKIIGDVISFEESGALYLWILAVSPEYRGRGIGGKLIEMTENFAKESGFKKVSAKVYGISEKMLALLSSRGYTVVREIKGKNRASDTIFFELKIDDT
jgi:ribosomal protein S18 acetylase RimI-like enzyme